MNRAPVAVRKSMRQLASNRLPNLKRAFGTLIMCAAGSGLLGSCGAPQTPEGPTGGDDTVSAGISEGESHLGMGEESERASGPLIICSSMSWILGSRNLTDVDLSQPVSRRVILDELQSAAIVDAEQVATYLPSMMSTDFEFYPGPSMRMLAAGRCLENIIFSDASPPEARAELIGWLENILSDSHLRSCGLSASLLSRFVFAEDTYASERRRIAIGMAENVNNCAYLVEPVANVILDDSVPESLRRTTPELRDEVFRSVRDVALDSSRTPGRENAVIVLGSVGHRDPERARSVVDSFEQILNEQNLYWLVGRWAVQLINEIRCSTRDLHLRRRIENILHDCSFRWHGMRGTRNPLSRCDD